VTIADHDNLIIDIDALFNC